MGGFKGRLDKLEEKAGTKDRDIHIILMARDVQNTIFKGTFIVTSGKEFIGYIQPPASEGEDENTWILTKEEAEQLEKKYLEKGYREIYISWNVWVGKSLK